MNYFLSAKLTLTTSCLLVIIALTGCEDVVNLNVPSGEPLLVVDGAITDQMGPYVVRLAQTAPYFSDQTALPVSGAVVVLTDNEHGHETLIEQRPGTYVTTGTLRGKVGNQYVLTIDVQGNQYRATTEIRRAPAIDSIRAIYNAASGLTKAGYSILFYGQEPAGKGDNYRFEMVHNGRLRNRPSDLYLVSDELVDGSYLRGIELKAGTDSLAFAKGDRVGVVLKALTADYYHFLNEVATQINNGGLFASPTANVRTNIRNLNAGSSPKAVGYFAGYAVSADSLVIK